MLSLKYPGDRYFRLENRVSFVKRGPYKEKKSVMSGDLVTLRKELLIA